MSARSALRRWGTALALASLACDSQPARPPAAPSDALVDGAPDAVDGTDEPIVAGTVVWRRLNRTEYRNTVRDLLGTTLDPGKDLPSDDLGYGFDNIASVLSLSPLHLELYERAARILAEEIVTTPITSELRLVSEGEDLTIVGDYGGAYGDHFVLWSPGELVFDVDLPRDGTWRFEMRANESPAGDERALLALWVDGRQVETFELAADAADFSFDLTLSKGRHALSVEFLNDFFEPPDNDRNVFIDWLGVTGPVPLDVYAETAWARHVRCAPEVIDAGGATARACVADTVLALATGAWRRELVAADVASLVALYDAAIAGGAPGPEALGLPLQALLMSPRFLYKAELPHDDAALDGYELATRLSYFLWSTMPDAPLMAAAADGLDQDETVAQVSRMLADPRAEALVQNFAGQWLYVRDVDNAIPDPWTFPEFDDSLRHAMAEEMRLFFRSFVFGERPMTELLTATDAYVNRRLAEHYGVDGPASDDEWTTVPVPGRRGVLTQAGLLTALSTPFRTSVVRRGKWVLGQLLCDEPSPPPPGVEGLVDVVEPGEEPRTLRQKMELHKTEERCRNCHQTMDAIGFGLEGFDGIGMERTSDAGFPIDASGEIRGSSFDGAVELAGIIAADARLSSCIVEKLVIYALGRGLAGEDQPLLDKLGRDFAARGYTFGALVELIATSDAFRLRETTP